MSQTVQFKRFVFLLQDPDGDDAKEEAGTVRRALL